MSCFITRAKWKTTAAIVPTLVFLRVGKASACRMLPSAHLDLWKFPSVLERDPDFLGFECVSLVCFYCCVNSLAQLFFCFCFFCFVGIMTVLWFLFFWVDRLWS